MRLLLVTMILFVGEVSADQFYKMTKVTCSPEIGLFEISATGVASMHEYYEPGYDLNIVMDQIAEQHGLYVKGEQSHKCIINDMKIIAQVNYRKSSPLGQCGGNPGARLTVIIDSETVVENMPFHEDCYDASAYNLKVDKYNVWVCGGRGAPSQCIWSNLKGNNRTKVPLKHHHLISATNGN